MENTIKWGVIGSGGIAQRRTIPEGIVAADHADLVAVYDIDAEVNNTVAEKFGAKAVNSIQELIVSDIDVVYIASPANMHLEHAIACAKGKKHVFCEKPLGMTVDEAEKMIEVCKEEGVLLGTGLMMRFMAQHQAALQMINDGRLGKPVLWKGPVVLLVSTHRRCMETRSVNRWWWFIDGHGEPLHRFAGNVFRKTEECQLSY